MNSLPRESVNRLTSPDHQILGDQGHHEEISRSFSKPLRKYYIGTLNNNILLKPGKFKQLTNILDKSKSLQCRGQYSQMYTMQDITGFIKATG